MAAKTAEKSIPISAMSDIDSVHHMTSIWQDALSDGVQESERIHDQAWEMGRRNLDLLRQTVDANLAWLRAWTGGYQRMVAMQLSMLSHLRIPGER